MTRPPDIKGLARDPAAGALRPHVSLIVCTRDRRTALSACLASLDQAAKAYGAAHIEIVVVDNGSCDDTSRFLEESTPTMVARVVLAKESRLGLAAARNAALDLATGEILAFIDDDCVMTEPYLLQMKSHYDLRPGDVIRGGRVELGNPDDFPLTIKTSPDFETFSVNVHPGGFVIGCNMTMPRTVADRIGRYDERFGAGGRFRSAEDTDYFVRAHRLNVPIEYVPDMTVVHHHGRRFHQALRVFQNYSFGNGALYMKHLLSNPWLARHFVWTVQRAVRELSGGTRFGRDLDVSHWRLVRWNLAGALCFLNQKLRAWMLGGAL